MNCATCGEEFDGCGTESGVAQVLRPDGTDSGWVRDEPLHKGVCCDCFDSIVLGIPVEAVRAKYAEVCG